MKKVADFLRYAERCERLAEAAEDDASRLSMEETARQWRNMAMQRELLLQVPAYRIICMSAKVDRGIAAGDLGEAERQT